MRFITGLALVIAMTGCVDQPNVNGKKLYSENCAACHGETGQGDGHFAYDLFTPPADISRLSARNGGTYPRDFVLSKMDGYVKSENSTGAMPEFGSLLHGRLVRVRNEDGTETPVPEPLLAISQYLEQLQVDS